MSDKKVDKRPKLAWYENNKDFTDPIRHYLDEKFNISEFGVPDKAETGIIEFKPNIIIFDYRMPFISGIEMYTKLKAKGLEFVTVFYTIWANDDSTRQKIIKSGIDEDAIIDKHMDCESFAKKVIDYFEKRMIILKKGDDHNDSIKS